MAIAGKHRDPRDQRLKQALENLAQGKNPDGTPIDELELRIRCAVIAHESMQFALRLARERAAAYSRFRAKGLRFY